MKLRPPSIFIPKIRDASSGVEAPAYLPCSSHSWGRKLSPRTLSPSISQFSKNDIANFIPTKFSFGVLKHNFCWLPRYPASTTQHKPSGHMTIFGKHHLELILAKAFMADGDASSNLGISQWDLVQNRHRSSQPTNKQKPANLNGQGQHLSHFLPDKLVGHPDFPHWFVTLVRRCCWHYCATLLCGILTWHSCGALVIDTVLGRPYLTLL